MIIGAELSIDGQLTVILEKNPFVSEFSLRDETIRCVTLFMFKNTSFRVHPSWCMARYNDATIVFALKGLATTPCTIYHVGSAMNGVFLNMKSTHVSSPSVHYCVALFAQKPHSRTPSAEEFIIFLNFSDNNWGHQWRLA